MEGGEVRQESPSVLNEMVWKVNIEAMSSHMASLADPRSWLPVFLSRGKKGTATVPPEPSASHISGTEAADYAEHSKPQAQRNWSLAQMTEPREQDALEGYNQQMADLTWEIGP